MALQKVPIEAVKGAGLFAKTFFDVVMAAFAVIAHLVDIAATGGIGFGGNQTAVGKLAHAPGIGHFNPFNRIDIDAQIPAFDLIRVDPREHGKVTGDH